jgi:hypothetical protein
MAPACVSGTVVAMAASFSVVDATGSVVDLAGLVRARADALAETGQVGDDGFKTPPGVEHFAGLDLDEEQDVVAA